MEVVVTGIGLASALGNLEQTWLSLLEGRSGIQFYQPFRELEAGPLGLMGKSPQAIAPLTRQVVQDALQDAGLVAPLPDCAVVVGSSRGNQALWEQFTTGEQGLEHWLESLPNVCAIATARLIQSQAIVLSPMAACATGLWAIARAAELIRTGEVEQSIAGAVEAPITPLSLIGFERMGALAKTGAYPFDCDREGLVLGEGGAVFVLESIAAAERRGAKIYGRILGFGLTADGYHVSAPAPGQGSAIAAVKDCLDRSYISANEIDYIHAHGTATKLNDQNEAHLIQSLFPTSVPVSSTKGATGHTLGASGALGLAFCLRVLKEQVLLPNVGLKRSPFELNLVREATSAKLQKVMCFSFGFGGQNGAIALARVD
jgi:3-oxoacyl-[acyl-carrier-protein] synthase II